MQAHTQTHTSRQAHTHKHTQAEYTYTNTHRQNTHMHIPEKTSNMSNTDFSIPVKYKVNKISDERKHGVKSVIARDSVTSST